MKYKTLGKTNKQVTISGFGGYRIDKSVAEHNLALKHALENGINLIDTSSNYSDGGSEELIGNVLTELGIRNRVVIVSKAGYIQGKTLEFAMSFEGTENEFKDIVKVNENLWHCIHPDFLRDEITNSLDRLNTNYLDVFLLHNPEYFLTYSEVKDESGLKNEYYRRIKLAFEYLETEVAEGRIQHYGISSNTFGIPSEKKNFTCLEKCIEIANSISEKNYFSVIEFPLNIIEKGGLRNLNQKNNSMSLLELAKGNNLGVLTNRTLNAIQKSNLIRLADFEVDNDKTERDLIDLLNTIASFEKKFIDNYISNFSESEQKELKNYFSLSEFLKENYNKFNNITHFKDARNSYFIPKINIALTAIYQKNKDELISKELNEYSNYLLAVLDSIENLYAKQHNHSNAKIHEQVDNYLEDDQRNASLSQKSILLVNSLREVSCSLIGMRKIEYVDEVIESIDLDYSIDTYKFWFY